MTTVTKEQITRISHKQAADGSFSEGSMEHQYAAHYIEEFLTTFDIVEHRTEEPEYSEFCAAAISALRDIQVRDYILGIISTDNVKTINKALNYLASVTPSEYSQPVDTLLALTYYELDQTDTAMEVLDGINEDYSLASLLKRVFAAGWPKEEFAKMRNELHPKVVAVIFGDKE